MVFVVARAIVRRPEGICRAGCVDRLHVQTWYSMYACMNESAMDGWIDGEWWLGWWRYLGM